MKRFIFLILFAFVGAIAYGQNRDVYISNPEAALVDANNAFQAGDFEKAWNLARIYNALSNTQGGRELMDKAWEELQRKNTCEQLLSLGDEHLHKGLYVDAANNYLSAYDINPSGQKIVEAILRCAKEALSNKERITQDKTTAEKMWSYGSISQNEDVKLFASYLGSTVALQNTFDDAIANKKLNLAREMADVANVMGNTNYYVRLGDYYVTRAEDANDRKAYSSASECLLLAADKGNVEAQYKVARLYRTASDKRYLDKSLRDLDKAAAYCNRAIAGGYKEAEAELESIKMAQIRQEAQEKASRRNAFWETFDPRSNWNDGSIGLTYTYAKNCPASLGINGNFRFLYFRADYIGVNAPFVYQCGDDSHMKVYSPEFAYVFAPGLFFNYFSVDIGLGVMNNQQISSTTKTGSGTSTASTSTSTKDYSKKTIIQVQESELKKANFMLQPRITGFIPIADNEFLISVHVGYNYIPNKKEMNGIAFGIGFYKTLNYL